MRRNDIYGLQLLGDMRRLGGAVRGGSTIVSGVGEIFRRRDGASCEDHNQEDKA